jgi:hypothetical protein
MSLFPFLMDLQNCGSTEDLAMQDYGSFEIMSGDSLPTQYDENVIFEILPKEAATREDYRHYNGHAWTHGNQYSIPNLPRYVKVHKYMYTGYLQYDNPHCTT